MEALISVLIVDNNDVTRSRIARSLLRRFSHALVQQCSERSIAALAARMPGLSVIVVTSADGSASEIELLRELREAAKDVPIVILSADLPLEVARVAGASYLFAPQAWIKIHDAVATIVRLGVRHTHAEEVELLAAH